MSTILDRLDELRAGKRVQADCPSCGFQYMWWIPGDPGLMAEGGDWIDEAGLKCGYRGCAYEVTFYTGPPDILCSSCGQALKRAGNGFRCAPCRREVRP